MNFNNSNISYIQLFRSDGKPSFFESTIDLPIFLDLTLVKLIIFYFISSTTLLLISLGFAGKERIYFICRTLTSVTVGTAIICKRILIKLSAKRIILLVSMLMPFWETNSVLILDRIWYDSPADMVAIIGIQIGLRGFNVSLKQVKSYTSDNQDNHLMMINLNEQLHWDWTLDCPVSDSFEEVASLLAQHKKLMERKLPLPVTYVSEYFTIDEEEFRIGRNYQRLGWYGYKILCVAVACWLLSIILFAIVVEFGSALMIITGFFLAIVNLLFLTNYSQSTILNIPFASPIAGKTVFLKTSYSWCFYVNLINSIFCLLFGLIIYFADMIYPDLTSLFFGLNIVQNYDQYFKGIYLNVFYVITVTIIVQIVCLEIEEEQKKIRYEREKAIKSNEDVPSDENESKYAALRRRVASTRLSKFYGLTMVNDNSRLYENKQEIYGLNKASKSTENSYGEISKVGGREKDIKGQKRNDEDIEMNKIESNYESINEIR